MDWFGTLFWLLVIGGAIYKTLDLLGKLPSGNLSVILILLTVLPMWIIFKNAFTETSNEQQDKEWSMFGIFVILCVIFGIISLFVK